MTNLAATTPAEDGRQARLDLGAALSAAVRGLPMQWRGAGGALVATIAGALISVHGTGVIGRFGLVLACVAGLAAFGAMTRIGVSGDLSGARRLGLGPSGFQATRVEARLLGAAALCGLFLFIMLSLLALVALALFGGAGLDAEAVKAGNWPAVGPVWKLVLLSFVGLIVLGAPIALMVRLSLFAPATVGRGQMISLTATGLTNGAMWPLLGGLVVCGLPGVACLLASVIGLPPVVWLAMLIGLQAPLTAGFVGAAYRKLERDNMLGAWQ